MSHLVSFLYLLVSANCQTRSLPANNYNGILISSVQVGSTKQAMQVAFSTASSIVWLRGSLCSAGECVGQTNFNHAVSTSFRPSPDRSISFYALGDTQVNCTLHSETMHLASLAIPSTTYCEAFAVRSTVSYVDGVVGLGAPGTVASDMRAFGNLFGALQSATKETPPSISFWYNRSTSITQEGTAGLVTLGGVDSTKLDGKLAFVPLASPTSYQWQIEMTRLLIGQERVDILVQSTTFTVDTGNTMVLLPPNLFARLNKVLGATLVGSYYLFDCSTIQQLPSISLDFGSYFTAELTWDRLVYIISGDACLSIFQPLSAQQAAITAPILGSLFLRNYVTLFDYAQASIGFGNPVQQPNTIPSILTEAGSYLLVSPSTWSWTLLLWTCFY
ncbi:hypothetical protein HDU91_002093 [Kappamyces sp. JEL0680]|nr:hypothetical protein HDU91_002093 [Kappamyces sp. JEL0680]